MKTRSMTLVAMLSIAPSLAAQAKPSGDELYNKYIEAAGGKRPCRRSPAGMSGVTSRFPPRA
jgi:hypothetical protein